MLHKGDESQQRRFEAGVFVDGRTAEQRALFAAYAAAGRGFVDACGRLDDVQRGVEPEADAQAVFARSDLSRCPPKYDAAASTAANEARLERLRRVLGPTAPVLTPLATAVADAAAREDLRRAKDAIGRLRDAVDDDDAVRATDDVVAALESLHRRGVRVDEARSVAREVVLLASGATLGECGAPRDETMRACATACADGKYALAGVEGDACRAFCTGVADGHAAGCAARAP